MDKKSRQLLDEYYHSVGFLIYCRIMHYKDSIKTAKLNIKRIEKEMKKSILNELKDEYGVKNEK